MTKVILKAYMADMAWHDPVSPEKIAIFNRLVLSGAEFELNSREGRPIATHPDLGDWSVTVLSSSIERYVE